MSEVIYPDLTDLVLIQSRAETNEALIEEYAQTMAEDGIIFDPVEAVKDSQGNIYVWDGYHRTQAARRTGYRLGVRVQIGTKSEAEWRALSANQKHGLMRTNADKQRVVRMALAHPNGARLSNLQIARHCGVSDKTAARIRREMEATSEIPKSDTRIGADGRTINTVNIGGISKTIKPEVAIGGDTTQIGASQKQQPLRIDQLESKVLHWLQEPEEDEPVGPDGWIEMLSAIKERADIGKWYLEQIDGMISEEYRKGDLIQACNNVLAQLRQRQREEDQANRTETRYCPTCGEAVEFSIAKQVRDFYCRHLCPTCGKEEIARNWQHEPGEWKPNRDISEPCPACGEQAGFESHVTRFGHGVRCNGCRLVWPYEQFHQLAWQKKRAAHIATLPCLECGEKAIKPTGDMDWIRCENCGAEWGSVAAYGQGEQKERRPGPEEPAQPSALAAGEGERLEAERIARLSQAEPEEDKLAEIYRRAAERQKEKYFNRGEAPEAPPTETQTSAPDADSPVCLECSGPLAQKGLGAWHCPACDAYWTFSTEGQPTNGREPGEVISPELERQRLQLDAMDRVRAFCRQATIPQLKVLLALISELEQGGDALTYAMIREVEAV